VFYRYIIAQNKRTESSAKRQREEWTSVCKSVPHGLDIDQLPFFSSNLLAVLWDVWVTKRFYSFVKIDNRRVRKSIPKV